MMAHAATLKKNVYFHKSNLKNIYPRRLDRAPVETDSFSDASCLIHQKTFTSFPPALKVLFIYNTVLLAVSLKPYNVLRQETVGKNVTVYRSRSTNTFHQKNRSWFRCVRGASHSHWWWLLAVHMLIICRGYSLTVSFNKCEKENGFFLRHQIFKLLFLLKAVKRLLISNLRWQKAANTSNLELNLTPVKRQRFHTPCI